MRSRRPMLRLFSPLAPGLSPLALVLVTALQLGCYKPNIEDGGFFCNFDAGAKLCPEGYRCEMQSKRCYLKPDAAVDRVDVRDVPDTSDVDTGVICFDEPKPGCTSGSGMCDPACRTGCDCPEKCSVNTIGELTCNVPRGQNNPKTVGQDCTIESAGSDIQTDNCGPGLLCMDDACYARCFQFCKDNGDCPTSSCSREAGGGQKVCDVPFMDTCSAILANAATGCGPGAMACYLSSNDPMHTICDCPLNAKGPNQDCSRSRECFPGLACVDRENGQTPKCLQVCRLTMGAIDCPQPATASSCHPYKGIPAAGSTQQHATFGYCY